MAGEAPARSRIGWTVCSLLGIGAWVGATVYVAANNGDPSDPAPILRTFALGAAGFFGVVFGAAAWQVRQRDVVPDQALLERLAIQEVLRRAIRAASRRAGTRMFVYLLFGGTTTTISLTAIGLGEGGPFATLMYVAAALVILWAAYASYAFAGAFAAAADLLAPLGLTVTATPSLGASAAAGRLVGPVAYSGERHGRRVSITRRPGWATTEVAASAPERSVTSAKTMAALTGEPVTSWRSVEATVDGGGVTVRRTGNGAGRWLLHDLLLAEVLAAGG